MIVGIGTDIVQIDRIKKILLSKGSIFTNRILVKSEYENFCIHKQPASFLAKRFAAKEAISKAFGLGIGKISFQDIEIYNNLLGAPKVNLFGYVHDLMLSQKINNVHLSLSDEKEYSVAFVVLEKNS